MKTLKLDSKWSIVYDPENNDRPERWLRHGVDHSAYEGNNAITAMFYRLLTLTEAPEYRVTNVDKDLNRLVAVPEQLLAAMDMLLMGDDLKTQRSRNPMALIGQLRKYTGDDPCKTEALSEQFWAENDK